MGHSFETKLAITLRDLEDTGCVTVTAHAFDVSRPTVSSYKNCQYHRNEDLCRERSKVALVSCNQGMRWVVRWETCPPGYRLAARDRKSLPRLFGKRSRPPASRLFTINISPFRSEFLQLVIKNKLLKRLKIKWYHIIIISSSISSSSIMMEVVSQSTGLGNYTAYVPKHTN